MREYQEKMLKSSKKIVMCNWERGDGKSYSVVEKLKQCKGKSLIISPFADNIRQQLEQYGRDNQDLICKSMSNKVELLNSTEVVISVLICKPDVLLKDLEPIRGYKFAYVFFDDYIPSSHEIALLHRYSWIKQMYIMFTDSDIEYIDNRLYKEENKTNWHDYCIQVGSWSMTQVEALMREYSEIPKNSNTTLTREKILSMIGNITQIREDVLNSRK